MFNINKYIQYFIKHLTHFTNMDKIPTSTESVITRITDFKTRNVKIKKDDIFTLKYTIDLPALHVLCKITNVTNILLQMEFYRTHSQDVTIIFNIYGHCYLILNPSDKTFWKLSKYLQENEIYFINIKQLTIIQLNTTLYLQLNEL